MRSGRWRCSAVREAGLLAGDPARRRLTGRSGLLDRRQLRGGESAGPCGSHPQSVRVSRAVGHGVPQDAVQEATVGSVEADGLHDVGELPKGLVEMFAGVRGRSKNFGYRSTACPPTAAAACCAPCSATGTSSCACWTTSARVAIRTRRSRRISWKCGSRCETPELDFRARGDRVSGPAFLLSAFCHYSSVFLNNYRGFVTIIPCRGKPNTY